VSGPHDPLTDPLIGAVVDGRWKVVERLGQGGMGTVYRGERLKLGKSVALKFLDERFASSKQALARFDRETRAISRLQHAHCVSIVDFGVHAGRPFIVMEYVAGKSLSGAMGTKDMNPLRGVLIMRQILDVLRHAHAHGVVHRDLKPDNVMLAEVTGTKDYVKILDFGLARIISVDEPDISIPALVAGTPSWMSPEQASGHKADHRSDLFTAGVILYGMCTGRKPFRADTTPELLRQIRQDRPTPPRKLAPGLSTALERVIDKAMAKSPDDRYYTALDFLAALDRTPEAKALTSQRERGGRGRWLALAAAALGLASLGLYLVRSLDGRILRRGPPHISARQREESLPPSPAAQAKPEGSQVLPTVTPATEASTPPSPPEPSPAPPSSTASDATRADLDALVDAGELAKAEKALRALLQQAPRTASAHLALGEIYFRRLWRADAIKEWEAALQLDPELRHDRRLGEHLCVALGPKWQGGARLLSARFADELVPTLERCIASADDYPRMQAAARTLQRSVGAARFDRGLVALRTLELAPGCEDRRTAVRTLARLHDARATVALDRLRSDPCLATVIPAALARPR
jgi:serine/threonine-protein kinase